MIGRSLSLDKNELQTLYISALLHDIGKLFIPKNILNKKTILTTKEYNLIKKHPTLGANYLLSTQSFSDIDIVQAVKLHHERIDGRGYPFGLKGDEIPLLAKIITIADSYDAMTTRQYNNNNRKSNAVEEIKAGRGTQFDKKIADTFLALRIP